MKKMDAQISERKALSRDETNTNVSFLFKWRSSKNSAQLWIKILIVVVRFTSVFIGSVQFSSVTLSCPTLCDPMNCSTPGLPVYHQLLESTQTHIHWVGDAIQLFHPLSSPSPLAFNLSQHQGLLKWVSSSHQVAKVLECQLQHQSCQCIFRTDFL